MSTWNRIEEKKNKLNLPQTIPRSKKKIIKKKNRKLLAKTNAHNKNRKKTTLTLKFIAFSQAMFTLILM